MVAAGPVRLGFADGYFFRPLPVRSHFRVTCRFVLYRHPTPGPLRRKPRPFASPPVAKGKSPHDPPTRVGPALPVVSSNPHPCPSTSGKPNTVYACACPYCLKKTGSSLWGAGRQNLKLVPGIFSRLRAAAPGQLTYSLSARVRELSNLSHCHAFLPIPT